MKNLEAFDFRPANDNEMAQLDLLTSYVFASPRTDDSPPKLLQPEWTHCAFDGQQMAACSGAFPFIICMNGKKTAMQGVTAVGTEPTYRRRGLVRQLITDLLHRATEDGQAASILLASRGAIYQRFGYGHASDMVFYEFDPARANFQFEVDDPGELKRVGLNVATEQVNEVYKAYARPRSMMALRAPAVWTRYLEDIGKNTAFCLMHYDAQGAPDGYVIYKTKWEEGANEQDMWILDFCYTNIVAYRALWNTLISHDLVGKIKWDLVPDDDPAPGLLFEPRCLNKRVGDGLWYRIVDVEASLNGRGYDVDGQVTFAIKDDDICPWNNQVYTLTVENGESQVVTGSSKEPDMTCTINALGSLVSGYADAYWLSQIGRLAFASDAKVGAASRIFSTQYKPDLSFGF